MPAPFIAAAVAVALPILINVTKDYIVPLLIKYEPQLRDLLLKSVESVIDLIQTVIVKNVKLNDLKNLAKNPRTAPGTAKEMVKKIVASDDFAQWKKRWQDKAVDKITSIPLKGRGNLCRYHRKMEALEALEYERWKH